MASDAGETASSSSPPPSSSTKGSWTYHVFLSFRGEDTRKAFTDHLFVSLERKGITTFKDDKALQKGEVIAQEILRAIEESMFAITILSPNYASSTWCLDELQKIVECKDNLGLNVVPIFYGVDPSDVRHQKGSFEEAFKIHEGRLGQASEKVIGWRNALKQVAGYSGWDSKNEYEAKLVEKIAQHIHKKLIPKLPSCTKNLVGILSKMESMYSLLGMGLNDVRFIGIWSMGGIGKTTLARAIYNDIQGKFRFSCFLRNVRDICETNGFVHLQRDLLSRLNISSSDFYDIEDGKRIIKNSLCNKKVLLVLDDVSEVKQLENLAEKQDWFGPGSRIIVTVRDMHVLNIHGVYRIYEIKGLDQEEACHLFYLKVFKKDEPKEGYLDLSKEVVEYTQGLPLAIEVLGSYLYGRNVDFWHSTIREIRSSPHYEILMALRISYNHLMPTEKNIFLDIACFFRGMNMDEVTSILKMCNFYVGIRSEIGSGVVTLIDKSLITLDQDNTLEMHDLLQEMGRYIVYEESPNHPGKRSRLWSRNDIDQVLTNDMGTEAIQGIVLRSSYEACWNVEAFSKITQLKLLSLRGVELPLGLNCLPSSLKVLHWDFCPLDTLPLADQQNEVVEIRMQYNNIEQLWHGKKFLEKLKYLDLRSSKKLKQTPDLSVLPSLKTLVLEFCSELIEVHPSLIHHKNLATLDLSYCIRLETFPGKLEMSSLKELILDDCWSFKELPELGECMKHLSKISLEGTAISTLPISVGCLVSLEYLNLKDCEKLICLPDSIHGLKSLKILNVSECENLSRLPPSSLKVLHWNCCPLETLSFAYQHNEVVEIILQKSKIKLWLGKKVLENLKYLDLSHSWYLKQIPDLSGVPILETLVLLDCSGLTEVHSSLAHHKNLILLDLTRCTSLKTLPGKLEMSSLEELNLDSCWNFENLPEFGECMKHLSRLSLKRTVITKLPTSIGRLVGLEYLNLRECRNLVCLPDSIYALKSLKTLNLSRCEQLSGLPPREEHCAIKLRSSFFVSTLSFLSCLDLSYCYLTDEEFPVDFCHFPALADLNLSFNLFVSAPLIHKLPKLRNLWLNGCQRLQFLPELPSSMRKLEACNCHSLDTYELNPSSKACSVFASPRQDHGRVLQMLISGRETPSWFVHQADGNCVSVPHNCAPNERLGIALCFQLQLCGSNYVRHERSLTVRNGKRFIAKRFSFHVKPGLYLYILCLTNECFSDDFPEDKVFELLIEDGPHVNGQILSSAARWVVNQDVEGLKEQKEK